MSTDIPSSWAVWRKREGLTQSDLAVRIGVEPSMVAHIEGGRRAPRVGLLVLICDVLNLTDEERLEAVRLAGEQSHGSVAEPPTAA